jgi:hypothetical protein
MSFSYTTGTGGTWTSVLESAQTRSLCTINQYPTCSSTWTGIDFNIGVAGTDNAGGQEGSCWVGFRWIGGSGGLTAGEFEAGSCNIYDSKIHANIGSGTQAVLAGEWFGAQISNGSRQAVAGTGKIANGGPGLTVEFTNLHYSGGGPAWVASPVSGSTLLQVASYGGGALTPLIASDGFTLPNLLNSADASKITMIHTNTPMILLNPLEDYSLGAIFTTFVNDPPIEKRYTFNPTFVVRGPFVTRVIIPDGAIVTIDDINQTTGAVTTLGTFSTVSGQINGGAGVDVLRETLIGIAQTSTEYRTRIRVEAPGIRFHDQILKLESEYVGDYGLTYYKPDFEGELSEV